MRFRCAWLAPLCAALLALSVLPAAARLLIEIDKSSQSMTVSRDGITLHRWPVSTGLRAHDTPAGTFTPFRMEEDHYSREWDDAPMPHSIFFTKKGHAIHGTTHLRAIGRPASHGCVRLDPQNARVLFGLVGREGMANTRVVLGGETPDARAPAMTRPPRIDERPTYDQRPLYDERPIYREPPGYYEQPRYGQQPRYDEQPRTGTDHRVRVYRAEPPFGYWVQYPDGRRIYIERDPRALPPRVLPPPGGLPYGWN